MYSQDYGYDKSAKECRGRGESGCVAGVVDRGQGKPGFESFFSHEPVKNNLWCFSHNGETGLK